MVITFYPAGLGDNSYVVAHQGNAVVVGPQRDFERFLAAADNLGAPLRVVCETHLHNDYVSGGPALADASGADLVRLAGSVPPSGSAPPSTSKTSPWTG